MRKGSKLSGLELPAGFSLLTAGIAAHMYDQHFAGAAGMLAGMGMILLGILSKVKQNERKKARVPMQTRRKR